MNLTLLFIVSLILGTLAIYSSRSSSNLAIREYRQAMNEGYNAEIKSEVQTVIQVLQTEYNTIGQNGITEEQAKENAKEIVRGMRYRDDASGYFWIDDTDYTLVMHPILPDQEGSNRYELEDKNGVMIIQEIMKVAEAGGGYNEFYFTKSDGTTIAPKVAYSQEFEPWGWVVSTGNYVDDMNHKNILQAGGNVTFQTTVHPNNIERTSDKVYYLFSLKDDNSLATTIQHEGVPHSVTVNFANIIYFYDSHNVSRAYFPYADYWLNKFMLRLYVSSIVIDGFTYDIINSQKIKTFTFSGTK